MSRGAGRLGWVLVWAVVFCDLGTAVFYVPGLLQGRLGGATGLFVLATIATLGLLATKVLDVVRRFPDGGGVVAVGAGAFGPWWGAVGGLCAVADFFLTIALCAASGMYYLDVVLPLGGATLAASLGALALLGGINVIGVKESATISLGLALVALVVQGVTAAVCLLEAPTASLLAPLEAASSLTPWQIVAGFGGAWLSYTALESVAQLAPAMRDLAATPRRGLMAAAASLVVTAPLLTLLATTSLPAGSTEAASPRLLAVLAGAWGGAGLQVGVGLAGAALLFFAANTAILGSYHVQVALTRRELLPEALGLLSRRYQTPFLAIGACTVAAAALLIYARGDVARLAELYGFGLLASLLVTSVGVDVLRWRDGERGLAWGVGVLTSIVLAVAFVGNLGARPGATLYAGGMLTLGLAAAVATRRGYLGAALDRLPGTRPPKMSAGTGGFLTIAQAATDATERGVLVASRGSNTKLFQEAVDRVRARGQSRAYLVYVDEVPGLFYPQLAEPTAEGRAVLSAGVQTLRDLGVEAVPVWAISHAGPATVAEAAEALRCDVVVVGATQRNFLWQALRGRFIQDLLAQLPDHIRLIVVG